MPLSTGVDSGGRGGDGGGSDVGVSPELLHSGVRTDVGCDDLSDTICVVLTAVCDDDSSARTTPGVKSSDAVEGWAAAGSADGGGSGGGDGDGFSGDDGVGLADGDVVGGGCGVVE